MIIPELKTARLTLRAHKKSDFPTYAAVLMSDRAIHIGGPYSEQGAWDDFCRETASWVLNGYGGFTVLDRANEIVGFTCLHHERGDPEREIGWVFTADGEGHGYAHEAATAVRHFAFDTLGWTTAVSYIDPPNTRSIRLAERLGATLDRDAAKPDACPECLVYRHPAPEGQS